MSGKSDLVVIGSSSSAAVKLWQSHSSVSSVLLLVFAHCMQLCCLSQQSPNLCFSPASMRFRPKRTCSGVEGFGGFHIRRFTDLLLFLRETLT